MEDKITMQLLEELRKSNVNMQELKQLIPRLEKMEHNQERLYKSFLVHEALMKPEDFKMLSEKVSQHDTSIQIIQKELGLSQMQIKEQEDTFKQFLSKAWEVFMKVFAPSGLLYLILESRGVL